VAGASKIMSFLNPPFTTGSSSLGASKRLRVKGLGVKAENSVSGCPAREGAAERRDSDLLSRWTLRFDPGPPLPCGLQIPSTSTSDCSGRTCHLSHLLDGGRTDRPVRDKLAARSPSHLFILHPRALKSICTMDPALAKIQPETDQVSAVLDASGRRLIVVPGVPDGPASLDARCPRRSIVGRTCSLQSVAFAASPILTYLGLARYPHFSLQLGRWLPVVDRPRTASSELQLALSSHRQLMDLKMQSMRCSFGFVLVVRSLFVLPAGCDTRHPTPAVTPSR
jgi:hypothetical protein